MKMARLKIKNKNLIINKIHTLFLDILFPVSCVACGRKDEWLCDECLTRISFKTKQVCPICKKKEVVDGKICFECRDENLIDGVLVASFYRKEKKKTIVAKLVHYYKYRFVAELGERLAKILQEALWRSKLPLPDIIIPVPLHRRRLRWRGFNQAEILAKHLSEKLTPGMKIKVLPEIIFRNKHTQPQMEIKNRQQRMGNLINAFSVTKSKEKLQKIKDKRILLIDDVATTGSTLFECAKILKQNGAKQVYAVVLARQ